MNSRNRFLKISGTRGRVVLRAFSLIELLVVISIIAVLAGLVVGVAPVASKRMREARIRAELAALVTAIESYKARYGVYPPDNYNPATRTTNPVLNPLFYELTGVLVDNNPSNPSLLTADDGLSIKPETFLQYFGREGVLNSTPRIPVADPVQQNRLDREQKRKLVRREFKPGQFAEIFRSRNDPGYVDLEVLAVGFATDASGKKGSGFPWPLQQAAPVPSNPGLNPWRYVSTNPTNNPGRFDLWAEIREKNRTNIVGNW
ncbi:MAG: type II secretion system protein [Limisphaerales bacterium]